MSTLKLYEKNGYCDIASIIKFALSHDCYNIFVTGGRGTGKTFGALKYCIKNKKVFMFVRRRQAQIDEVMVEAKNPLIPVGKVLKKNFAVVKITKSNAGFYYGVWDDEKNKYLPEGDAIGYTACATNSANSRGFDASDVEVVIYDEFIPERTEHRIRGEAISTFNLLETVNRNREIDGKEPTLNLFLANSMNINNALYAELELVDIVDEMERKGYNYRIIKDRGILIIHLYNSPISEKKKNTSLYKMTRGSNFNEMALGNVFTFEEKGSIKSFPIKEFTLYISVAGLHIYRHKSASIFYCTLYKTGSTRNTYGSSDLDITKFRAENPDIYTRYIFRELYFDRYATELKFKALFE